MKPTEKDPVLLLLNGHGTHNELQVILYAREHHVHMLSYSPYTTYKLHPLDRTFMKPFKAQYNHACNLWMRANRIYDYDIAKLVNHAYTKVCRLDIVIKWFKLHEHLYVNWDIFTESDFVGSAVTNIENTIAEDVAISATEPSEAWTNEK